MSRLTFLVFLSIASLFSCRAAPGPMVQECDLFENKSKAGNIEARIMLANCYVTGVGRDRDIDKAEALLRNSMGAELVSAENNLGALLLFKRSGSEQHSEGIRYLQSAKEKGAVNASTNIGIAYLVGRGVNMDVEAGLKNLEFSAERREALASLVLFSAYELGHFGVGKDAKNADKYWERFYRHFKKYPSEYFHWYVEKLSDDDIIGGIVYNIDQLTALKVALKERAKQITKND